jgi:hypothetical protein
MQGKTRWLIGGAVAVALLAGALAGSGVSAQTTPEPDTAVCPGPAMMSGGTAESILAAHTAQMEAAVAAGWLTQDQADAMTALMTSRLERGFAAGHGMMGGWGMMGGGGMMGPGVGPAWRTAPSIPSTP